jgi:general stress protein CsbA
MLKGFGLRRKLVVLKYTLQRGYAWAQIPTLALIGAGVLKPYFPNWTIWTLGAFAMMIYLIIGLIDRFAGLLHEETNYGVEMSPLLMRGLKGELRQDYDKKTITSTNPDASNSNGVDIK